MQAQLCLRGRAGDATLAPDEARRPPSPPRLPKHLVHVYFRLDAFRDRPLSPAFLADAQRQFDEARASGVKLVPRFTYNFPAGLPLKPGDEDAPLPLVLRHIEQLKPLLRRNSDVIAFMEAGFVGAWGEWHHSTSGLDSPEAKRVVLEALLKALPASRFIALRYQRDKVAGPQAARIGHHNDCFLAAREDWGTYRGSDAEIDAQKAELAADNRVVPQGGETCNDGVEAQPYIQCPHAVSELKRLHWSQLNADYHPGVLGLWRKQGCYGEIARRLGYRLRLVSGSFPEVAAAGGVFEGSVLVANDGFAAPYNRRGVELVLRHRESRRETILPLREDPRQWSSGETRKVVIRTPLPAALAPGTYDLLLNLPDPELRRRPQYNIRLANRGTWEAKTGYNRLLTSVTVLPPHR
ncbi:MAG: DUF4832 domain-containing protein [Alphaproteobacteria bacterium]|nr:MAG: DUF4832 domain-containing protein [Alphaproteobacteria bacterium]